MFFRLLVEPAGFLKGALRCEPLRSSLGSLKGQILGGLGDFPGRFPGEV